MRSETSFISDVSSVRSASKPSEEYIYTYITLAPDGGWGWIVVMASFLCHFVIDGAMYTFGIFLKDISKTFNTDSTEVAVANSVMVGVCFVSGPITCAIVNRFGFQVTGFMGGVLTACAFSCGTLTKSISAFIAVFGVLGGFAAGMIYVPSVVAVGFYFERWRALATSIAVTGSGAGIIGFPMIIESLLSERSWQFKFQVIAGIMALVGLLTLLYRPLKSTCVLTNRDKTVIQFVAPGDTESILSRSEETRPGFFGKLYNRIRRKKKPLYRESTMMMYFLNVPSASSVFISSTNDGASVTTFLNTAGSRMDGRSDRIDRLSTVYEDDEERKSRCRRLCCGYKCCKFCCGGATSNRPMYRNDIFFQGSVYTLPEYTQVKSAMSSPSEPSKHKNLEYTMSVSRIIPLREEKMHCLCCPESVFKTLTSMLSFQLLKSVPFVLLVFSGFFTVVGMYVPFIYLIERADEFGIERSLSYYFFTALGASNLIGRILSGIISSIPQMKPLFVSYISLFICGLATIVSYFLQEAIGQFVYCSIFGLTIACFASLRTPIIADLLGLENLTNGFGLVLLMNGIGAFLGIPLAGKIKNATGSFNESFLFAGAAIILSAIMLMPIKAISEWGKKT